MNQRRINAILKRALPPIAVLALTTLLILTTLPQTGTASPTLASLSTNPKRINESAATHSFIRSPFVDSSPGATTRVSATLRSSPGMFIENVGQFDDRVRFWVRSGAGMSGLVRSDEDFASAPSTNGLVQHLDWSLPINISQTSHYSAIPAFAVANDGSVHIVWWDAMPDAVYTDIFYAVRSTTGFWSTPLNISNTPGSSVRPCVAVDDLGNTHVVWFDSTPGNYDLYYAMRSADGTWSPPVNISNNPRDSVWSRGPLVAADASGLVHAVWTDIAPDNWDIYYAMRSTDGTWSPPVNISDSVSDHTSWPDLAIDDSGGVHVVWTDDWPSSAEIYYAMRSADGTWSSRTSISNALWSDWQPQIVSDTGGCVHVVWTNNSLGGIHYAMRSTDGTWSSPANISNNSERSREPKLDVDASGVIHVVWEDNTPGNRDIYYALRSTDGTWSPPVKVTSGLLSAYWAFEVAPRLAVDAGGLVHVVWADNTAGNWDIYYAMRSTDGTWSSLLNLSRSSASSRYPDIAVAQSGNGHAVWTDGEIWYSTNGPPPISFPQGKLQLHMPDALPPDTPIRPVVTVVNENPAPADYTVVVQLWRGFGMLDEQTQAVSFAWSGRQQLTFNFGVYDPDSYYIWAELWRGGERLEVESRSFSVGLDYLKLRAAAGDLTVAAYAELNDGENIAVDALAQAAATGSGEVPDFIAGELASFGLKLGGISDELARDSVGDAVAKLGDWGLNFSTAIERGTYDRIAPYWRNLLDGRTFNGRRDSTSNAEASLLEFARGQTFTWDDAWQAEIVRRQAAIQNKNETVSGLGLELDFKPPFVHRASLVKMKGQFDWLNDELLPHLERWSTFVLFGLLFLLLVAVIIVLLPTSAIPPALLAAVVIVAKAVAVLFPLFVKLLWTLKTSKVGPWSSFRPIELNRWKRSRVETE